MGEEEEEGYGAVLPPRKREEEEDSGGFGFWRWEVYRIVQYMLDLVRRSKMYRVLFWLVGWWVDWWVGLEVTFCGMVLVVVIYYTGIIYYY